MKKLIILGILFIALSCQNDSKETVTDGDFKIEFLFEKDGCKMYRFKDGMRYIYWSNCEGKVNYDYTTGGKSPQKVYGETVISK